MKTEIAGIIMFPLRTVSQQNCPPIETTLKVVCLPSPNSVSKHWVFRLSWVLYCFTSVRGGQTNNFEILSHLKPPRSPVWCKSHLSWGFEDLLDCFLVATSSSSGHHFCCVSKFVGMSLKVLRFFCKVLVSTWSTCYTKGGNYCQKLQIFTQYDIVYKKSYQRDTIHYYSKW